ncbi:hypothetical protein FHL15_005889 [Xylaria flabelliformis]|uniref:Uncharacterized protein n=1 Tax=Xylaria flabelliformis TaxID=2512241 RepID=A0A553HZC5_9PEZI|nr:hypothetical protein FHL15_005889 [Xylaria flabelliformis]
MASQQSFPDDKIAHNVKREKTMDLQNYSLNTVIGSNTLLWQLPKQWTKAHLRALRVDRKSDGHIYHLDGDEEKLSLHAIIPDISPSLIEYRIKMIIQQTAPLGKALYLSKILISSVPTPGLVRRDGDSLGLDIKPVPFIFDRKCNLGLAVGRRTYLLPLSFSFNLGSFMLPYIDSWQIRQVPVYPSPIDRSLQTYEPCIAAILIALAQRSGRSTDDSRVTKTQLLFTHRFDDDNIYIYTAHIGQPLLERFRHPCKPPTTNARPYKTPYLIKLQHQLVPYKPFGTFAWRLLAALSITVTIMAEDNHIDGQKKRKRMQAHNETDPKRSRQETPRARVSILYTNRKRE